MNELGSLAAEIAAFRDERDWKQFHNPKDVALSLVLEAAELLEIFQWKQEDAVQRAAVEQKDRIAEELADVFYYALLLAHDQRIDLVEALRAKLKVNGLKYPIEKARGSSKKYTEL